MLPDPWQGEGMTPTQTAPLGPRRVRRMGFGAMQLAGPGVFGPPRDRDAAQAVLRRAIALGVDHIDTSQYYGPDVVNDLIRETLHPYPPDLRLVTKVGARRDDGGRWLPAQHPEELRAAVHDNLRALRLERMDLVNLRRLDHGGGATVPMADQLGALEELRGEGKIELIGVSNVSLTQVEAALEVTDVACVQNAYSLLDRTAEDLVELCASHGLAFVPFFPLGSAFTGGPSRLADDPAVSRVAAKHDALPSQVALSWLLHRGDHVLLIPGTSSVTHLEENLAAADLTLDGDDLSALDGVAPSAPSG